MRVSGKLTVVVLLAACGLVQSADLSDYDRAAQQVERRSREAPRAATHAHNVILFIGDGMGISTITAARILEGQRRGESGEDNRLSFEEFPYSAFVRTFSANQQVSDSAPTATAMVTGWHANDGALSVAPTLASNESDAKTVAAHSLQTLLELAEGRGLATGIVTTTSITDATPAANYAHTPNRNWQYAGQLPPTATLADIAVQLVTRQTTGDGLEVVFGGGREVMTDTATPDPEYPARMGRRNDARNLIKEWVAAQRASQFVWKRDDLLAVDPKRTRHLLGLFEPGNMHYEADRTKDPAGEPSLAEMTRKAIEMLSGNSKGFYLIVEGGCIDHAHHAGNAYRALTDTIAFSDAVRMAASMTNAGDTLIMVTADHSHVLTISGYPARGNPILGLVKAPGATAPTLDYKGQPYATLSYATGPGFSMQDESVPSPRVVAPGRGQDLTAVDTTAPDFHQQSLVGMSGETHGGEDVALYARGPGADLARGAINQNEIYHIMRRALGF
ncbi:MAG: alkaline phosphatase [Pseudomonadota bacterium]